MGGSSRCRAGAPALSLDDAVPGAGTPSARSRPSGALALELGLLRAAYAERLLDKLAAIRADLEAAWDCGPADARWAHARRLVHRLRGSAGSYGFGGVSDAMAQLEWRLEQLRTQPVSAEAWAEITRLLRHAHQAAASTPAPSSHPPARGPILSSLPSASFAASLAHLLVIDDDPDVLGQVALYGRAASLDVTTARDGHSAIRSARGRAVDVALVDLHLARGDCAAEVVRGLRGLPGHQGLPVVAFSADDSVRNRIAACEAGASLFLRKPVDMEELAVSIRGLLEHQRREVVRVLLVDDDPEYSRALCRRLSQRGWFVEVLPEPGRIFEVLSEVEPHLLLLDVGMPTSGYDLCRVLRASQAWQGLPVLFLTGSDDAQTIVRCYDVGGDDCIAKTAPLRQLEARARLRLQRTRLFQRMAHEDALTGLLTRRALADSFDQRMAEAARRGREVSIVLFDIDQFKQVNDSHGHAAGDRVLRHFGRLLTTELRAEDAKSRWGGEEFLVVMPETALRDAAATAERVLTLFSACCFVGDDGGSFNCTFSAGVATFPRDADSPAELLRRADGRLYAAKTGGRARVVGRD